MGYPSLAHGAPGRRRLPDGMQDHHMPNSQGLMNLLSVCRNSFEQCKAAFRFNNSVLESFHGIFSRYRFQNYFLLELFDVASHSRKSCKDGMHARYRAAFETKSTCVYKRLLRNMQSAQSIFKGVCSHRKPKNTKARKLHRKTNTVET